MGGFSTQVIGGSGSPAGVPPSTASPYRPQNWSNQSPNTSVSVTSTTTTATGVTTSDLGNAPGDPITTSTTPPTTQTSKTTYFFDSVMAADHYTELTLTRHPVQSSTSIVDHAYAEPARVVLEVMFSDAMASYTSGQYATNSSKSVSAYQTFVKIQQNRQPLTLTTHLQTYENMLIRSIRAADTNMTVAGAKMTIVFEQIIVATLSTTTVSARPNQSQTTNNGTEQPSSVPPSVLSSHAPTNFNNNPPGNPNPPYSSDPVSPESLGLDLFPTH